MSADMAALAAARAILREEQPWLIESDVRTISERIVATVTPQITGAESKQQIKTEIDAAVKLVLAKSDRIAALEEALREAIAEIERNAMSPEEADIYATGEVKPAWAVPDPALLERLRKVLDGTP